MAHGRLLIIDTDILIDFSRGIQKTKAKLTEFGFTHRLAISVVTQLELMIGCENKQDFRALERFLADFEIIQLTSLMSIKSVELFESYRLSHGVLIPDMLIAATAIILDAQLYSKNKKDFRFIDGLKLKADEP